MKPKNLLRIFLPLSLTLIIAAAGFAADALPKDIPLQNNGLPSDFAKTPSEVSITSPQLTALLPNQASRLTYSLFFLQPWTSKTPPEITANLRPLGAPVDSSETNLLRAYVTQIDTQHFLANIPIPKLMPGDYTVSFGYYNGSKFLQTDNSAFLSTTVNNRKPKNLTDNGTILWHDKLFFPIGMYYAKDSNTDYKLLSENGFNAIQGSNSLDMTAFKKSLDEAQKYGLAVDVPLYSDGQVKKNLANSLEKIKKFADHPAVLCWKILEEPDVPRNAGVAVEVPEAYRAFKAADPNHPIELTLVSDATLGFWSNFSDIIQLRAFRIHSVALNSDLTAVSTLSRNAKSMMEPWQNITFDVQNGSPMSVRDPQPTVPQARSMVYLALISGAKGIFWDLLRNDSGLDLTKTPLWPHIKDINAEIKANSEPIMTGLNVPMQTTNPQVHVMARRYQNKLYVFFTNPTTQEIDVTFRTYGLAEISDGKFTNSAFTDKSGSVKVDHSVGAPNSINMKLQGLQSGTMVFDIAGK